MKISKTLAATGLVLALSLGSAVSASASELVPSGYPITNPVTEPTDTDVSVDVKPKDRKVVDGYRKIKRPTSRSRRGYRPTSFTTITIRYNRTEQLYKQNRK